MPHNRSPKPGSKYYLPKYKYRTVVNFCFQYRELKDELLAIDGWHSGSNDGMPHGTNTSDPTASDAMRRAEIEHKIEIIEETVSEVSGTMSGYMMRSITDENCTYAYLRTVMNIPIGKNEFSQLRRKIYFNISKKI